MRRKNVTSFGLVVIIITFAAFSIFALADIWRHEKGTIKYVEFFTVIGVLPALGDVLYKIWLRSKHNDLDTDQFDHLLEVIVDKVQKEFENPLGSRSSAEPLMPISVKWLWGSKDIAAQRSDIVELMKNNASGEALEKKILPRSGLIVKLYDDLYEDCNRIVIIGEAGAGKTQTMLILMEELLSRRIKGQSVPIWVQLAHWDPAAESLKDYVTRIIKRMLPRRFKGDAFEAAEELLRSGRITLFLDGLDEMHQLDAVKAIKEVDQQVQAHIVLSSRREQYEDAHKKGHLRGAAVLELQPVQLADIRSYLLHDQQPDQRKHWQKVIDHIKSHPNEALNLVLRTPLMLWLARVGFSDQDPEILIHGELSKSEKNLKTHLLGKLFEVSYPNKKERDFTLWWLGLIAFWQGGDSEIDWVSFALLGDPRMTSLILCGSVMIGWAAVFGVLNGITSGYFYASTSLAQFLSVIVIAAEIAASCMVVAFLSIIFRRYYNQPNWQDKDHKQTMLKKTITSIAIGVLCYFIGLVLYDYVSLIALFFADHDHNFLINLLSIKWNWYHLLVKLLGQPYFSSNNNLLLGNLPVLYIWPNMVLMVLLSKPLSRSAPYFDGVSPRALYYRSYLLFRAKGIVPYFVGGFTFGIIIALSLLHFRINIVDIFYILGTFLAMFVIWQSMYEKWLLRATELQLIFGTRFRHPRLHIMKILDTAHERSILRQEGVVYVFRHIDLQEYLNNYFKKNAGDLVSKLNADT